MPQSHEVVSFIKKQTRDSEQTRSQENKHRTAWDHITKLGEYEHHIDPMPSGGCIGIKSQPGLHGMLTEVN